MSAAHSPYSEMRQAVHACMPYFLPAALFGAGVNILYLASPLYLLQVYDRVVSSGSVPTLVMLTLALALALLTMAALDHARARVLIRAGLRLDRLLGERCMAAMVRQTNAQPGAAKSQALRDLDTFRQFLTGSSFYALFDAPWAPLYLVVIALLHPLLGVMAVAFALILLALALLNEAMTGRLLRESGEAASRNYALTEAALRNSHAIEAMGMLGGLLRRWSHDRYGMLAAQAKASDRAAGLLSLIRFLRLLMQSLILGAGAYLVIQRDATGGVMFAAMFLLSRALAPVDQAVAGWRPLVAARSAYRRLDRLLAAHPALPASLSLPRPQGRLSVQGASFVLPGMTRPVLRDISFEIEPGETLGIVGPSGAGKSTLARLIVGIQSPQSGVVRLDGANVATWSRADFGRHVGYLPQEIELFADTVAANISRFGPVGDDKGEDDKVLAAAMLAGAHELILELPKGNDTMIEEGGANLSGGHRQRIALARALYGEPSLLVLDEPSSNLDMDGDMALGRCLERLKDSGQTVIVISHRPVTLNTVDKILVLQGGGVRLFGTRAEVMAKLGQPAPAVASLAGQRRVAPQPQPQPVEVRA
ncbi:MAG: type I secretion system permease/ATPase [Thiohalocapsa sp.]